MFPKSTQQLKPRPLQGLPQRASLRQHPRLVCRDGARVISPGGTLHVGHALGIESEVLLHRRGFRPHHPAHLPRTSRGRRNTHGELGVFGANHDFQGSRRSRYLDGIFGAELFRNEIIWKRTTTHSDSKTWSRVSDTIVF